MTRIVMYFAYYNVVDSTFHDNVQLLLLQRQSFFEIGRFQHSQFLPTTYETERLQPHFSLNILEIISRMCFSRLDRLKCIL